MFISGSNRPPGFFRNLTNAKAVFFILLLAAFQMFVSYHILSRSRILHSCDEPGIINDGWQWFQDWKYHRGTDRFRVDDGGHPPLHYAVQSAAWHLLSGVNAASIDSMIIVVDSVYLLVLLLSVYGIGGMLCNRKAGLAAVVLVSAFPVVFGHTRAVMLDLPMAAATALALFLLLKNQKFALTGYSVLAGLAFGLAMATKESAIVFLAPPLIYYFFISLKTRDKLRIARNFFLFLIPFLLLTGFVYLRAVNFRGLWFTYYTIKYMAGTPLTDPLTYVFLLPLFAGPYLLILCLPLIVSHVLNIVRRDKFLFVWFFIPFVAFSTSPNAGIRYMLPLAVPFCLISVRELFENARLREIRNVYIPILVVAAITQYILVNGGVLLRDSDINSPPSERGLFYCHTTEYYDLAEGIYKVLKRESEQNKLDVVWLWNPGALEIPSNRIFDHVQLNLLVRGVPYLAEYPINAETVTTENESVKDYAAHFTDFYQIMKRIPGKTYIIQLRRGASYAPLYTQLIEGGLRYKIAEYIKTRVDGRGKYFDFLENVAGDMFETQFKGGFTLIAQTRLADGPEIRIYKHNK
jgi:4-amino-4-deoxy-L-arabinose transferase-like glycosyltransferase